MPSRSDFVRRHVRASLSFVLLALLAACSDSTGPGGGGSAASQVVLTLPATSVGVGSSVTFDATVLDALGETVEASVSWSSDNPSVATVSRGVVTGRAVGTTTIRAVTGGAEAARVMTVGEPVASVTLAGPAPVGLPVGARVTLAATLRNAAGATLEGRQINWTVATPAVARVEDGVLIGVASGTTNLIAASEGRADTASLTVGVAPTVRRALATRNSTSCGLTNMGAAWCWGSVLGETHRFNVNVQPWPREIGGGVFFETIAVSRTHACGLTSDGQAWCWGSNAYGELGSGGTSATVTTVASPVQTNVRFSSIHLAEGYTLALATDGRAWAWGRGGYLGDGTTTSRSLPVQVAGGHTFRLLTNNPVYGGGVGITTGNVMYEWRDFDLSRSPVEIYNQDPAFVSSLTTLHANGYMVAGLTSAGQFWAWTWLVEGSDIGSSGTPSRLQPGLTFRKVETNGRVAIGLTTAGTLVGWGNRNTGALGDGNYSNSIQSSAVSPSGGRTYTDFTTDGLHVFAIDITGRTYAWGGVNDQNALALGVIDESIVFATPQAPVSATLTRYSFALPITFTLEPGQSDTDSLLFYPLGGSFNRDGTGMAVPNGPQTLSIGSLPSGVTSRVRRFTEDWGAGPFDFFEVRLTAASNATASDVVANIQVGAPGATPLSVPVGVRTEGPPGAPLNLVCTSSATPSSFPPGHHCMTNPAGAHVPGKFAVVELIGSWYESTAGVCVNYGSNGTATTRFKPGLGGGAVATESGKWGVILNPDGTPTAAGAGWYIYTAPHDDQMKALVFYPTSRTFAGYNFQRGGCPW